MPAASVRGGRTDAITLRWVISRAPMRASSAWQHRCAIWLPGRPGRGGAAVMDAAGAIVDSTAVNKEV